MIVKQKSCRLYDKVYENLDYALIVKIMTNTVISYFFGHLLFLEMIIICQSNDKISITLLAVGSMMMKLGNSVE